MKVVFNRSAGLWAYFTECESIADCYLFSYCYLTPLPPTTRISSGTFCTCTLAEYASVR